MKCQTLSLAISGPRPGDPRDAAQTVTALVRELRTRTGLEVLRIGAGGGLAGAGGESPATGGGLAGAGSGAGRAKGGGMALAELVVAGVFAGSTVGAFAQIVVAFVQRGAARRIVLSDGARTLTVTDPSADTQRAVAEWLNGPGVQSGSDGDVR